MTEQPKNCVNTFVWRNTFLDWDQLTFFGLKGRVKQDWASLDQEYRGPVENLGVSIGMDYAASLLKIETWLNTCSFTWKADLECRANSFQQGFTVSTLLLLDGVYFHGAGMFRPFKKD